MRAFRLDESAIEQYHRNGYWLFREAVFSPTQFERLTGIFEELLAKTNKRGDE